MKKILIIFCVAILTFFSGCNFLSNEETNKPTINIPSTEEDVEIENEKKTYAVSKVNALRIRSKSSSSSVTLGYLDKGDAVLITDKNTYNGFYKTIYKEQTAYLSASYCDVMSIDLSSDSAERAIDIGSSLLGYPYVWGSQRYHWGNGKLNTNFVKGEFDCSALVQYAYYHADKILLDVTSRAQSQNGVHVEKSELKRGDLMFFTNASRKDKVGVEKIGHVGIYFGNNYILHTASDHAVIEPISALRWSYYLFSRRVA